MNKQREGGMKKLNHEGHDESQYLPRGTPPVNAFRAQHGKVRWEGQAVKAITWMPELLLEIQQLREDEVHICKRVERAAISAMAALGISNLRTFISGDMNIASLPDTDPFKEILRGMKPCYSTALLWVICDDRNGGNIPLALKMLTSIRTGIDFAKNILEKLDGIRNNAIVASGVVCENSDKRYTEFDPVL